MDLPKDPYDHLESTDKVKLQAYVEQSDKEILMTVIPNRNLYTILITYALKRTADFIRANDLEYGNPDHAKRLLDFITTGVDSAAVPPVPKDGLRKRPSTRAPRNADARNDA